MRIVLQNASIQSASTAPIYIKKAKKVILSLPQGTKNSIIDTDSYEVNTDKEPTAAIFSKADLTINGSGELQVNASYKNGIQSKDKLKLLDANLQISAANDAVKGKDALYICDGTYTIKANKDGFVTTNQEKGAIFIGPAGIGRLPAVEGQHRGKKTRAVHGCACSQPSGMFSGGTLQG